MRSASFLSSSWILACASLLLLGSLTACSSTESATSSDASESAEPAPVERPAWNQGNDTYLLRLAPEVGARYKTQHTQQTEQNLLVQGNEIDVTQDQTITQELHVADYTAEGVTALESTIARVQVSFNSMGNSASYDSDAEEHSDAGPLVDLFDPVVGNTLRFDLNQNGGFAGNPDTLAAQIDTLMGSADMGDMSDPSVFVDPIMSAFRFYPDTPVSVGESWETDTKLSMGLPFDVTTTYTLDGVTDAQATIDFVVELDTNGSTIELGQGIEADAFLSGTQSGTLTVDLESGLLQSMERSGSISGFAEFTPPGQNEMMEMDMDISSTVSFESERMADTSGEASAE